MKHLSKCLKDVQKKLQNQNPSSTEKSRNKNTGNASNHQAKLITDRMQMMSITNPVIALVIEKLIDEHAICIFARSTCPFCKEIQKIFDTMGKQYKIVYLDQEADGDLIHNELILKTAQRTVPNVFIKRLHIGGCDRTKQLIEQGKLKDLIDPPMPVTFASGDADQAIATKDNVDSQEYDIVVIGGGSGGNACIKEALSLGARGCVLDYVNPSPVGTTWGYGGTCVNVGCIPKKLMHQAALIGEYMKDAEAFGWNVDHSKLSCDWSKLTSAIGDHIHSLNFKYRLALRKLGSGSYINSQGEFLDAHRLKCVDKKGQVSVVTAKHFVIACGGRPQYPGIPGDKEYGITSDDLFWLPYYPGKTLIVGASYIALECAGFLREIGCDVTVMVRSIFLRGFDQQMAKRIAAYLESIGVKFILETVPTKIECIEEGKPGKLKVHYKLTNGDEMGEGEWNTVMFAIGRFPDLSRLHLERTGVLLNPLSGKIITMNEQSSVSHIYALGDCAHENRMPFSKALELTPVAIKAGQSIASRLFGKSQKSNMKVDYNFIPTTVFTPIEYGACGFTEEDAVRLYKDRIEAYHTEMEPFEWTVPHRGADSCYLKLIALKSEDPSKVGPEHELVIGFHYVGPFAGELTQGFALALKKGATKADFDNLVGIHPTCAESFTKLTVSKSSGKEFAASGC